MLCKVYIKAVNWQVWLENILLWFPWWNVKCGARCSHVFGEHIHPHLNSPLKPLNTRTQSFKRIQTKTLQHKGSFKGVVGSVEYDWWRTCSIPGLSGWSSGLVSTCSGTSLQPTFGISFQCFNTVRARCSSVCFFRPEKGHQIIQVG